jgi:4-hydroxybenzoate polyprenyltransferase
VPFILAAWLQLIRVMVVDLDAEPAQRAAGRRTVAVRLGRPRAAIVSTVVALAFIPVSLVLPARAGFGGAYFLIALFVELAVLVAAARVIVGRMEGINVLLKGAMVMGAMALVAGRIT